MNPSAFANELFQNIKTHGLFSRFKLLTWSYTPLWWSNCEQQHLAFTSWRKYFSPPCFRPVSKTIRRGYYGDSEASRGHFRLLSRMALQSSSQDSRRL